MKSIVFESDKFSGPFIVKSSPSDFAIELLGLKVVGIESNGKFISADKFEEVRRGITDKTVKFI